MTNRQLRPLRLLATLPLLLCSCTRAGLEVRADDPQVATYLQLMMPRRIEIQRYLTRPVHYAGKPDPDGIEVILATYDSAGDPTKAVGTFQFELYRVRPASGDRRGEQLGLWPVDVNSAQALNQYWDRLARLYRFPLKLESSTLRAGKYILGARLRTLAGETLFDEYEFTHE